MRAIGTAIVKCANPQTSKLPSELAGCARFSVCEHGQEVQAGVRLQAWESLPVDGDPATARGESHMQEPVVVASP